MRGRHQGHAHHHYLQGVPDVTIAPGGLHQGGFKKSERKMDADELHARMLKKKLWVVFSKPAAPLEEIKRHLQKHLEHQIGLEKQGILFGAGPMSVPGAAAPSFGMIIIRADDLVSARRIMDSDPMHSSGMRTYEIFSWSLNEGRIGLTIDYSDQTFKLT